MRSRGGTSKTFASLHNSNYRKYFTGQTTSMVGTWMQTTAQAWLVYTTSHSGTELGIVVALQTIPILVLGPYAGLVADRVNRRTLLMILQSIMGLQALALGLLTVLGDTTILEIEILAFFLGLNNAFENPVRQSFMLELVGADDLRNAVSLNSVMMNVARAIGPAVAGILIAAVGTGICFLLNAASFIAVVGSLWAMDVTKLSTVEPQVRTKGQLMDGFRYVRRTGSLLFPLLMMALVGTLAYEFQVSLPILARATFHSGSRGFGFMTASMGVGAIIGGLLIAGRGRTGIVALTKTVAVFGVAISAAVAAPNYLLSLVAIFFVGWASVSFLSIGNSTLQLGADPTMRGRVMGLWSVAFMGTTPIGGPIVGYVSTHLGSRYGLGLGALSCFVAVFIGAYGLKVMRSRVPRTNPTG